MVDPLIYKFVLTTIATGFPQALLRRLFDAMLYYKCYIFTNAILVRLILELIGVTPKQQTNFHPITKMRGGNPGQPARQAYNTKKKKF